ncbi:MAG: sulfotransferase family protein [Pseudomonadota bacterium]
MPDLAYFSPLSVTARAKALVRWGMGQNMTAIRLRRRFCQDPESYFEYFSALLNRADIRLTGDITPSYSALPVATLREIKEGFSRRGIPVKVIFMMRDPVERCHSALSMYRRERISREGVALSKSEDEAIRQYAVSTDAQLRTRYDRTLEAIEQAFNPEHVFIGFYETIFAVDEVKRLSAFLDLEPDLEFVNQKVNVSPRAQALTPETKTFLRQEFAPVYETCARRFPITEEIWQH